ncbi:MAG: cyclase family protein [Meiothermus sp.]|nr:cyclase family protein [Meiothermus sp.]
MSSLPSLIADLASGKVRVVDLTQPLSPQTPVIGLPPIFAPSPGLSVQQISRYDQAGPGWYWNTLTLGEHTGTHFDAPVHWVTGQGLPDNTTETIPAGKLVAPANVLDFGAEAAADEGFLLEPAHIEAWEAKHGRIEPGTWVLLRTGWSKRTGAAFLNVGPNGPVSPGPSVAAVKLLVERDILGFGVETVGTDAGAAGGFDPPFPAHTLFHGSGRFGLASLCNLEQLPPKGALLITPPLKLVDGSGSPLRVLALVEG